MTFGAPSRQDGTTNPAGLTTRHIAQEGSMMNDPTDPICSVVTEADQRRIRAAMAQMPYAASVPMPTSSSGIPVDVDAIVAYLEALAAVLMRVAGENSSTKDELDALKRDLGAVRRIFGVTSEVTS